jgi:GT2 family glycosyltransferase
MSFNPLKHPIVFSIPRRLTPLSFWHEHMPFAMFLIDLLRPETLVELGTQYGDSYCAFCQSVQELNLATRCYAIDNWQGDPHVGSYGPEVLADLREHHEPLYGGFSRLIQSTFDDALSHFADGSVDLLHIDAYHIYEAVKHDFQSWLPKMSERGVVLFHDTNVRERDFGVWKLWKELQGQYPNFEFLHGSGLGVLAVGKNFPTTFQEFLEASSEDAAGIRRFFVQLGQRLTLEVQQRRHQQALVEKENQLAAERERLAREATQFQEKIQAQQQRLTEKEKEISNLSELVKQKEAMQATIQAQRRMLNEKEKEVSSLNELVKQKEAMQVRLTQEVTEFQAKHERVAAELEIKEADLNRILASHGWKGLLIYYRVRNTLLPEGTWQSNFAKRFFHWGLRLKKGLSKQSGLLPILPAVCSAHESKEEDTAFQPEPPTPGSDNVTSQNARSDVQNFSTTSPVGDEKGKDYELLSQRISELRRSSIERVCLKPPAMDFIGDYALLALAESLHFSTATQVEVSIVIPVFNNLKFTVECLTSLMKHSKNVAYEIIVVDDGSSDQTAVILPRVPNITYLKNQENLGFVRACNRGAESARGEYILFLNNDTQVTENWLKPLVDTFKEHDRVGAVGAKILFPDGRLQEAGALVNRDGTSRLIGLFDDPDLPRHNYVREVMYCSGACLLVEAKKFTELGGFDASLAPAYCEDWDLAFRLREHGLRVMYNPSSAVIHHLSVTSNDVDEGFKMGCVVRNQQKLSERWQREIDNLNQIRLIAFYLPQFHPIPENDRWWGKGFTEWTNVSKGRPNFVGHYQPHLPADLGFYDLRAEEVMVQQAELAKRYGIYGFCYFYYWFAGKRLLDFPLERILKTDKPNIPFCLCWANENWTRKWDGREQEVLIAQEHSDEDDRAVICDLMRYMRHRNYIRIHGRPLLIVYRITLFPNIKRTVQIWRDQCLKDGLGEIYLVMAESFEHSLVSEHPSQYGFDASVEFPPHGMHAPMSPPGAILNPEFTGVIHDYREIILDCLQKEIPGYVRFRSVVPSWDNTPRRQNDPVMFENTSPEAYQALLEAILDQVHEQNFGEERIVFINAWNEWGEGNHIEPDRRYGHGFLEASRNALESSLRRRWTGLD